MEFKNAEQKEVFPTKREATNWKDEFLMSIRNNEEPELTMLFEDFYEIYVNDISNTIRYNSMRTKKTIFEKHVMPYFKGKRLSNIRRSDIIRWQNLILELGFKETYARTINNQLFSLFNHAERYYELKNNPVGKSYAIGMNNAENIQFWTKEEFDRFIKAVDNEVDYIHFNVFFYTGIRVGELISIRLRNINIDRGHIEIRESAQFEKGEYIFSKPKTKKSERIVIIPIFLTQLIKNHVDRMYCIDMDEQVFLTNKTRLARSLKEYAEKAKVKKIRIHDLRHSHASLLIEQGIQPNIIQERLGHEKIETTLKTYSHLYPYKQYHLAEFLDMIAKDETPVFEKIKTRSPLMIEKIK